jgi:hypothetical protein
MDAEFERLEPAVTDGRLSLSEAYARILAANWAFGLRVTATM